MPEQDYLATDTDWAWAAGLFEGEGYVKHYSEGNHRRRGLMVEMTDEDVIRRLQVVVGAGTVTTRKTDREDWKRSWRWQVGAWPDIERIGQHLLPYLGARRSEALSALLGDPVKFVKNGTHCHRGHEFTPENTAHYRGSRHCRECRRINTRNYRERNKEKLQTYHRNYYLQNKEK